MKVDNPTVEDIRQSARAVRVLTTLDGRRFDSHFSLRAGVIDEMFDEQIAAVVDAMNRAHENLVKHLKLVVKEQYWELTA